MPPPRVFPSPPPFPFAIPPMAGLHDIWPMVSRFWVSRRVRAPARAASAAASAPACPAPITMTSYRWLMEGNPWHGVATASILAPSPPPYRAYALQDQD